MTIDSHAISSEGARTTSIRVKTIDCTVTIIHSGHLVLSASVDSALASIAKSVQCAVLVRRIASSAIGAISRIIVSALIAAVFI